MVSNINLKHRSFHENKTGAVYLPQFFSAADSAGAGEIDALIAATPGIEIHNEILSQCKELVKIRNPSRTLDEETRTLLALEMLGENSDAFGCWVFYPWSSKLIHILGKEDFIELRTSRNQYKITPEEQQTLAGKSIGIIGLSVGQTIAITIAIERICGEIRLADFDELELSNLNRIRAPLSALGLSKVVIAAREIAEIDPYLVVVPYFDGINDGNITEFLSYKGKIDLLIEECDGLDVKILSRIKARELQIPVIMETNDRGMLDIERFDIEPERSILHGLIDHLPFTDLQQARNLNAQEKLPYLAPLIGIATISDGLRRSVPEIGKTITTWPQLASAVMLGSGIATETARKILLGDLRFSGRWYVDLDEIIHKS